MQLPRLRIVTFSVVLILVLTISCICLSGCVKKEKFNDYSFDSFDTVTTITGFETSKEIFDKNCEKIKEKLEYYEISKWEDALEYYFENFIEHQKY